jgi:integrase
MLLAGVPPNVVQQRLGHKKIEITLGIYAHVLPGQQKEAPVSLLRFYIRGSSKPARQ